MGRKRGRYEKRSPEQWRQLVEEQRSSGESVCGFAKSRGISKSSMCRWVKRFCDEARVEMSQAVAVPYEQGKGDSQFLELVVQEQTIEGGGDQPRKDQVRLLVGDGVCLELPQLPPPEYLAVVARAYEAVGS